MRKILIYTWSKSGGSDLNGMQLSIKRQVTIITIAIKAFENNEEIEVGIYEDNEIIYRVVIEPNKYGVVMYFYNKNKLTVIRNVTKKELYN